MNKFAATMLLSAAFAATAFAQAAPKVEPPSAPKLPPNALAKPEINPTAVITTNMGVFHCTLFRDRAPMAVDNFVGLATGSREWVDPKDNSVKKGVRFYDGLSFHRVIPGFMIQGGDPLGTGEGGPGYDFPDEFNYDLRFDQPAVLAYANSGPNTNGSQFFITEKETPHLNACLDGEGCVRRGRPVQPGYGYTVFGQCDNAELVKQISSVERDERDKPKTPITIVRVDIVDPAAAPRAVEPSPKKPMVKRSAAKK